MAEAGFVYLLRLAEFHKIGCSANPGRCILRFKHFPWAVSLVHAIASDEPYKVEKALHRRFRDQRVQGEWFLLAQDDIDRLKLLSSVPTYADLPKDLRAPHDRGKSGRAANLHVRIPSDLALALDSYVAEADPPTTRAAIVELALVRYLTEEGRWPPGDTTNKE